MVHAIRIHETGGPEMLRWEDIEPGAPGPGQLRVRHTAVGLNFIDTYHRSGLYKLPLPTSIGREAAGVVEAVGDGVDQVAVGDRVCYGSSPPGAYAQARVMSATTVLKTPDAVGDQAAAAMMLKGMTVRYLIRAAFRVQPGMTVLFHAAAGGVGLIACQWLSHIGATVIGTVGNADKAKLAAAHGCHHTVLYNDEDFVARVREITDGQGVPVVYDGVGNATWEGSLDCLSRRGMMVSYGNASGAVPPFSTGILNTKGSLFLTRPKLDDYTATRAELEETAGGLFDVVASGAVKIEVNQTYPLSEAVQAHRDLEARRTTGSTVLLP